MANKYYCNYCERGFDEDDAGTYTEYEGEGVMRGAIYFMCCPYCGGDDLEDAEECMGCGETFPRDVMYSDANHDYYCKECRDELIEEGEWDDGNDD